MFQLIVAVISIALVAALALASIFYGGEAFTRGQLKAQVATMINQGQQISGANTLYKTDKGGVDASVVADLTRDQGNGFRYLAVAPTPPSKITEGVWELGTDGAGAKVAYVEIETGANTNSEVDNAVADANVGATGTVSAKHSFYFPL
jgi:hypothetical protein